MAYDGYRTYHQSKREAQALMQRASGQYNCDVQVHALAVGAAQTVRQSVGRPFTGAEYLAALRGAVVALQLMKEREREGEDT